jgi:hypothetical protein
MAEHDQNLAAQNDAMQGAGTAGALARGVKVA